MRSKPDESANKLRVILYTVITGKYDVVPKIVPEKGVDYWLFTDDLRISAPSFWNKSALPNPMGLNPRRLSRRPKMRPHYFLPPHDVSVYMDANLVLLQPIRDFALKCIRELPIAAHPHPKRICLYVEGRKCLDWKLDRKEILQPQMERYQREQFPKNFGLMENSFLIRRNIEEVNRFNDLWDFEYSIGSERDQLSFMYCLWRCGLRSYVIWQNARQNSFFQRGTHRVRKRSKTPRPVPAAPANINGAELAGIQALIKQLPSELEMVLVNSGNESAADVFAASGKVKRMWCAELCFDDKMEGGELVENIQSRHPGIVNQSYGETETEANRFPNQSLDLVYLDRPEDYERTKRQLESWRPKVRAGGFIGGQNYSNKFQGAVRAIYEQLGNPQSAFADSSWLCHIPKDTFGIVSYCSLSYLDAFECMIDSWLQNCAAREIVIYTDSAEFEKLARPRDRVRFIQAYPSPAENLPTFPWERKIEVIEMYFGRTWHPYFIYLDCDCWVQRDFSEVFQSMRQAQIIGTRLLRRDNRGGGEANAGVIFFRHHPALVDFLRLWKSRAENYKQEGREYYEQDAFSHLLIEAFDGIHSFQASLVSERIYNSEHDNDSRWLGDIKQHQPKILHFKCKRFRNEDLKQAVFSLKAMKNSISPEVQRLCDRGKLELESMIIEGNS